MSPMAHGTQTKALICAHKQHIPLQVRILESRVEGLQMVVGGRDLVERNARLLRYLHTASVRPALDHRHPRFLEIREVVGRERQ
jgi:hypothetical protein